MTTTPVPQPAQPTPDATQPSPPAPTQPLPAAPRQHPAAQQDPAVTQALPVAQPRLRPAQQWARYEAAQRAARQPVAVGAPAQAPGGHPAPGHAAPGHAAPGRRASAHAATGHAPGASFGTVPPGSVPPGEVPPDPWAAPGAPAPRRRSRVGLWVTSAAVVGLLVGGGAVAGVDALDLDGPAASSASLADVGSSSNDRVPVSGSTTQDPDWQAVASAVQASVVAIDVRTEAGGGQGSGVIIDDRGHVLTNDHVVAGAQGTVRVTLTDGRILEGEVVGTDASTDLAVVRLLDAPDDLRAAALGDSDDVAVGDPVMAVGNPLGLANTVTTGIVSAVDRPVSTAGTDGAAGAVTNAIQVDAAVNPGNSGGPLFDATGRVVGVTSSIATLSQQSGSIGLGFAIPSNLARGIASQLIEDGEAEHAFLGVSLSDGTATADGVTRRGAVVEEVTEGSPAAAGGVQDGDVVVAIGEDPVGGAESLTAFVRSLAAGDDVTLTVVRDGRAVEVEVTLATRPDDLAPTAPQAPGGQDGQGQDDQDGQEQDGQALPGDLTPQQLWEWFQQQRDQG